MTNGNLAKKSALPWRGEILSLLLLGIVVFWAVALSGEAAEYVRSGMRLAVGCVIPTAFPFMIISDLYTVYGRAENLRLLGGLLSRVLGIHTGAIGAFICGNVAGFPIGAKMCAEAYSMGAIKREDAERLIPLCNNPSCAFVIGGVGIGMCGDIRVGFILLASVYAATLICALLTRPKDNKSILSSVNIRQNYNFIDSVKRSGTSSLSIISFICVFSVVNGIIKKRVKNAPIIYLIFSLLEVTNAVDGLTKTSVFPPSLRLALVAFSLGFGGVCVGMQSSVFVLGAGLKMKNYYLIKLLEGLIAASISTLIFMI